MSYHNSSTEKKVPDLASLEKSLGMAFSEPSRLTQALTHSSYVNENPGATDNERLEFLGDAVLGLVIAEQFYRDMPRATEGEMTRRRADLVSQDTLARLALALRLGDYLRLGRGEEASGGRAKPANLARALEAVIAAVYLDQGREASRDFILRIMADVLTGTASEGTSPNYKSRLQELIQGHGEPTPSYHVLSASGPDHDRLFTVEVRSGGRPLGQGSGKSKKQAESEAARNALANLI
jgi:ribonuclease-3